MRNELIDALKETLEYMESSSYPESLEMTAKAERMIRSITDALAFVKERDWRKSSDNLPERIGTYLTNGEYGIMVLTFLPNKGIWVGAEDFHTPIFVSEWSYVNSPK